MLPAKQLITESIVLIMDADV